MNNTTQTTNNTEVFVIWTDPSTGVTHEKEVEFETKLDFSKMCNVVIAM